jgi:hypothetical protein
VRTVASGEAVTAPTITARLIAHYVSVAPPTPVRTDRQTPLTARERDVLVLIALGLSNGEILGYECGLVRGLPNPDRRVRRAGCYLRADRPATPGRCISGNAR